MFQNPAISFTFAEGAVLLAIAFTAYWSGGGTHRAAARFWSIGFFLMALSSLSQTYRQFMPQFPILYATQIIGVSGLLFCFHSLRLFRNKMANHRIIYVFLILSIALLYYTVLEKNQILYLILTNGGYFMGTMLVSIEAATLSRMSARRPARMIAFAMAILSSLFLARGVIFGAGIVPLDSYYSLDIFVINIGIRIACEVIAASGFMWLIVEAAHRDQTQALLAAAKEQERRKLADSANIELRNLLSERSDLIDVLAHEVRQPLNEATGCLELLTHSLRDPNSTSEIRLERSRQTARILDRIIYSLNNTLIAATTLHEQKEANRYPTNLGLLVETIRLGLSDAERERLEVILDSARPKINIDPVLVGIALNNLIRNALTHGSPTAQVTLRVYEPIAGKVRFEVQNDGTVDTPIVDDVAFVRERRAGRRDGFRLGLWIVGRVAQMHSGDVRGKIGPRTVFAMTLSTDPKDTAHREATSSVPSAPRTI